MGRARRMGGGTHATGLAIEYVRKRKVVRLLGWLSETAIEPVEIPVAELCRGLGIGPADVGAPQLFLLFAGSQRRPEGGLRDLAGAFEVEDDAWAAFRQLRQSHPSGQGWAELAVIDASARVNQLAWFGVHPDASRDEGSVRARPAPTRYLRAVTPS